MAYSVEQWAKVKADYESGKHSFRELQQKYNITYKAIFTKANVDNWVKGKCEDIIQAEKQLNMIEKFSEIGYKEQEALKDVRQLIRDNPKEGLNLYFKLVGTFAPVRREVTGKDGESLIPSKMSEDELDKRIKSMIA